MAYTTEEIVVNPVSRQQSNQPNQFDLPSKEFIGYDPKGTTSITGSPLVHKQPAETAAPTDPANAPVPEVPKEEIALSPKLSALARKEQAQRLREKQLAEKEKSLAEKLAKAEKYEQLKAKIAAKDYSSLEEEGVEYEQYVKHELTKEAAKDPAAEKVRQLEEKLSALEKAREEDAVKEYQANQALWKQEIVKAVSENEEFSTIKDLGAEDMVLKHINDSFEEDNTELTVEQAAKEIEDALLERAEKFASVTKLKNKVPEAKVLGAPKTAVKTITQNMTVTSAQTKPKPFHLMSEAEQIAEAIRRVQSAKLQR
jgi:hypothetical protein